ncbi:MAG: ribosome hibernation-promoting factor, HPF/YfiA family [Mycoplasmatales bacterium]
MKINVIGKNIEVTDGIKDNIKQEFSKLDKYFKGIELECTVQIKTYTVGQKVEVSLPIDKDHVLRQEVIERNLYHAIDVCSEKLEKQIRKLKNRLSDHVDSKQELMKYLIEEDKESDIVKEKITRRKELDLKPTTEEEALLQFELIGHDFYVFYDSSTEQKKIIYKRKSEGYGIIVI